MVQRCSGWACSQRSSITGPSGFEFSRCTSRPGLSRSGSGFFLSLNQHSLIAPHGVSLQRQPASTCSIFRACSQPSRLVNQVFSTIPISWCTASDVFFHHLRCDYLAASSGQKSSDLYQCKRIWCYSFGTALNWHDLLPRVKCRQIFKNPNHILLR